MTIFACAAALPLLTATIFTACLQSAEPTPPAVPASAPVSAGVPASTSKPVLDVDKQLQHKITVDFQDVALSQAVENLRKISGVDIAITPNDLQAVGDPSVTIKVDGVPIANVLLFIEQMSGLSHRIEGNRYVLVPSR